MADPRHRLGMAAEEAVATWLAGCGWRILARRQRSPGGGEVDLVAVDPQLVLVGVEVRARRSGRAGAASWSVDLRRVRRLRGSLAAIGAGLREPHAGLRVDLVTVEPIPERSSEWRLRRLPGIG